jgi:hypothetical protein
LLTRQPAPRLVDPGQPKSLIAEKYQGGMFCGLEYDANERY